MTVLSNMFDSDDMIVVKGARFNDFRCDRNNQNLKKFEFICVNPIDVESDGRTTNSNVIKYRNFVIENDTLEQQDQLDKIEESKIPFSHQVWSGNTSVHNIVSLDEPLDSEETYRMWFKAISAGLDKFDYKVDVACVNPSRLSRTPEATRTGNGNLQSVLSNNGRITQQQMLDWFESVGVNPEDYKPKQVDLVYHDGPDTANDEERWEVVKRFIPDSANYMSLQDGEREPMRFRIILKAKECGLTDSATLHFLQRDFPSQEDNSKLADEVNRSWRRDVGRINVMSKDEWKQMKEREEKAEYDRQFADLLSHEFSMVQEDEESIDEDYDTELHRYLMVGNKIYMLVNRELKHVTMDRFTVHFQKRMLRNVHRYVDFVNEPGYLNYQPVINQYYNEFKVPKWRARRGNWDTIEHYLRHISNGQYEMLLDYLQISLTDPKQKLPILILMSYDKGTGKSTFFDLLKAMFGDNVAGVSPNQFQLEWNTQWINKHFIFVDEAEKIDKAEDVASKLKRLCYATEAERNKKGDDTAFVPFNGRFVLASNQAAGFVEIDERDDRYWVLNVPKYTEEFDPEYVDKLRTEVPHFIYSLTKRKLSTQNEGRGWFNPNLLKTQALMDIIAVRRDPLEIEIEEFFSEYFEYRNDDCNFIVTDLMLKLSGNWKQGDIKTALHKLWGLTATKRCSLPDSFNGDKVRQKYWYTVKKEMITTVGDINDAIAINFINDYQ